ncbi:MAG: cupin domain-containing protein [Desulfurella sp.]|uniref:cupin domain-containing protein n=1 Tax=Desulfurella sp. TaxID=1962857 RepID=UPI003D0CC079
MKVINLDSLQNQPVEFNGKVVSGVSIRWLIKKEDGAPNFAMRYFEMQPHTEIPAHSHPWEHEIFILDGECEITVGNITKHVSKNSAVFIEPNIEHSYKNNSDKLLKFLCIIPHT